MPPKRQKRRNQAAAVAAGTLALGTAAYFGHNYLKNKDKNENEAIVASSNTNVSKTNVSKTDVVNKDINWEDADSENFEDASEEKKEETPVPLTDKFRKLIRLSEEYETVLLKNNSHTATVYGIPYTLDFEEDIEINDVVYYRVTPAMFICNKEESNYHVFNPKINKIKYDEYMTKENQSRFNKMHVFNVMTTQNTFDSEGVSERRPLDEILWGIVKEKKEIEFITKEGEKLPRKKMVKVMWAQNDRINGRQYAPSSIIDRTVNLLKGCDPFLGGYIPINLVQPFHLWSDDDESKNLIGEFFRNRTKEKIYMDNRLKARWSSADPGVPFTVGSKKTGSLAQSRRKSRGRNASRRRASSNSRSRKRKRTKRKSRSKKK